GDLENLLPAVNLGLQIENREFLRCRGFCHFSLPQFKESSPQRRRGAEKNSQSKIGFEIEIRAANPPQSERNVHHQFSFAFLCVSSASLRLCGENFGLDTLSAAQADLRRPQFGGEFVQHAVDVLVTVGAAETLGEFDGLVDDDSIRSLRMVAQLERR